ncbi:hypothetical protein V6N11_035826 [Hibiscus sabdariffa]|uniref:Uncharacterized protein n=1 Tax=Hibiscus sabdariffa TaxID=183260 RepID=A0ABR2R8M6_9ROSI
MCCQVLWFSYQGYVPSSIVAKPSRSDRELVSWVRPSSGWCKLDVDGARDGFSGITTCGGKSQEYNMSKKRDQNSFFFRHVAARNKANTIRVLFDDQGTRLETYEDISKELIRFFSSSLGEVDLNVTGISDELLKDILGVELSEGMREGLITPVLGKEIKDVFLP